MIRSLFVAASLALSIPLAAAADDGALLARAISQAEAGDWQSAEQNGRAAGEVSALLIDWMRLRSGMGDFAEFAAFVRAHPDWPGLKMLRKAAEPTIRPGDPADEVIAFFAGEPPQTGEGSLALAAAHARGGAFREAEVEAVRAWRSLPLSAAAQAEFLSRYGEVLAEHHGGRMAEMLGSGNVDSARRMLPLVSAGTRAVAEARLALQTDSGSIDAAIAAVPARMAGSAGLALDRFLWRIRKDRYDEAIALMLERSDSAESLGDPALWSDWRRKLARREMRLGDPGRAYKLAARHHLPADGADYTDLEWLAGYIALRKLGDAETALKHFARVRAASSGPITTSRAAYWQGRAHEVLGDAAAARQAWGDAAMFQTAFYGLLAAEKVGLPLDPALAGGEPYPDWRSAPFAQTSPFAALVALHAAGADDQANRFALHIAEGLSGEDIGRLAGLALEWQRPGMALLLAKAAADKGVIWPTAYFPLNGIEDMRLPVRQSLALAIARRESEFNPRVVSSAGAMGLMQVMPGTAKMMAAKAGLAYERSRLTGDWRYNVALGSAYLEGLIAEFGTSPVLVAAGYNAGPGRPRGWIADFGDPRSDRVDVVDWIEHIPFRETQNYVMRVSESLPIYRARITGKTGPLAFTDELKGR